MAFFRWFALSPDEPRAEPLGKDFRVLRMIHSEMSGGRGAGAVGVVGRGDWGCLASSSVTTLGVLGASPPEVSSWIAFLYRPSPTAVLARLALVFHSFSGVVSFNHFWWSGCPRETLMNSTHRIAYSSSLHLRICAFTCVIVECRWERPPLVGLAKTHLGNMKNFDHALTSD